jgi:RPN1 N-terminal domain
MALLLGRDKVFLRGGEGIDGGVIQLNSNLRLHEYFKELARRLELTAPKSPEEVYKKFLEPSRSPWLLLLASLH